MGPRCVWSKCFVLCRGKPGICVVSEFKFLVSSDAHSSTLFWGGSCLLSPAELSFDGHLSPVMPVLYGVPQGSRTSALCHVHCRSQQTRHTARSFLAPVRWRLSSLSFIDCQWHANLGRPIRSYWRRGRLAKRQPVTFESYQDSSIMAGLEIFSGQDHCPSRAGPAFISPETELGVVIDSHVTMADHVTAVYRAAYFHLRQLRLITRSLSVDVAMTLVQSFIRPTCHLDYCNSLFSGINTDSLLGRLQLTQNAAARLVAGTRRCDQWPLLLQCWGNSIGFR